MNLILLSAILSALRLSWAADITFAAGANCTGEPLFGGKNISSIPCYDISFYESAESVVLSRIGHGQVIRLYTDTSCRDEMFIAFEDTCYQPPAAILSFLVEQTQPLNDSDKSVVENTTDLVPYQLSTYKGLGLTDPYNIDLKYSNVYIGVATGVTSFGLTIFSFTYGCATTGGNPLSIVACAATPLSTILSVVSGIFIGRYTKEFGAAFTEAYNLALGSFTNVRRSVEGDFFTFDYLSTLMNDSDFNQVGHLEREFHGIKQISPMYEVPSPGGEKWHFAAFFDNTTGNVVHHMHSAAETEAVQREHSERFTSRSAPYPENGIRWQTGGLDFVYCPANSKASTDGFTKSANLYNVFYDQITCLKTYTQLGQARNFLFTLYNEEGVSKGNVFIAPYVGDKNYGALTCPEATTYVNQDCLLS